MYIVIYRHIKTQTLEKIVEVFTENFQFRYKIIQLDICCHGVLDMPCS